MCGICGYITKGKENIDEYRELLNKMQQSIAHRGPDDVGIYQESGIGLAHRRLSILDLSSKGHQPMEYKDKYVVVYNGEIYNYLELKEELVKKGYVFDSDTDTEVLVAAYDCWGKECLELFNGMWAFAIWDKVEKKVFCARDRFGVKPFYYHINGERFIFASEIKCLLKDEKIQRIANKNIVYDYLTQGLVEHTEETFFDKIYKLPAATYMIIQNGEIMEKSAYYDVDFVEDIKGKVSMNDIIEFGNLFRDAVSLRLRADVPVGSCLSGGLDSSSIVCCVDELIHADASEIEQHTFSFCTNDSRIDERKYMHAVTEETKTISHQIFLDDSDLKKELNDLIYTQDEPFSSTGMYASYCVYRDAKNNNVSVLLDGQGADEILCGYRKSRIYYVKRLIKCKKFFSAFKEMICSINQMNSTMFLKNDLYKVKRIIFKEKGKITNNDYLKKNFKEKVKGYDYDRSIDFQHNDVFKVSLPALLRYADRNSMAFSVESRLPFLDYRFVEFCAKQPLSKKIKNGTSKYIMRQSLKMPDIVKKRKDKIGFATPEDVWLKNNSEYLKGIFNGETFLTEQFVDRRKILEEWDDILERQNGAGLFRYVCLELWARVFEVKCVI